MPRPFHARLRLMRWWAALLILWSFPLWSFPPGAYASAERFWNHWGDGKAEVSAYRLQQPRYKELRDGHAILIFVTEEFSDKTRVKADPGNHPDRDVYSVLKLNDIRRFQTGIYDYATMTSTFSRVNQNLTPVKISFSSQEWCGQVYQQILPYKRHIRFTSHSYFDGEADQKGKLRLPKEVLYEDNLFIRLRGLLQDPLLEPGQKKTFPLVPSLMSRRLDHKPLRLEQITLERLAAKDAKYTIWKIDIPPRKSGTLILEATYPHRIIRWEFSSGESGNLLKSLRLPYWTYQKEGHEQMLKDLGL